MATIRRETLAPVSLNAHSYRRKPSVPHNMSAQRAGRPLPPVRFLVLISVRGRVDSRATVRLEGLAQLKNPVTSSGIEPATFRLVA
jgi:hypothetical protein